MRNANCSGCVPPLIAPCFDILMLSTILARVWTCLMCSAKSWAAKIQRPRLHTYARLSAYAFFVGQPRLAERSLEEVRRIAAQSTHHRYDVAFAECTQAHL